MALILCQECRREISDRASACPHCGCPVGQPISSDPTANTLREMRKGLIFPQIGAGGIVVAQDGSSPYRSIGQSAESMAEGGIIFVKKGQYAESVHIRKSLTIAGVGKLTDVIVSGLDDGPFLVNEELSRVEFHNLTIRNGVSHAAISVARGRHLICSGCDIDCGSKKGIALQDARSTFVATGCYVVGGFE